MDKIITYKNAIKLCNNIFELLGEPIFCSNSYTRTFLIKLKHIGIITESEFNNIERFCDCRVLTDPITPNNLIYINLVNDLYNKHATELRADKTSND